MIGIICAMEEEIENILLSMKDVQKHVISSQVFNVGVIDGKSCVVALCGVGKVNAAMCTQTMILKYNPDFIINTGIAGGIGKNVNIGDIVIADFVMQHDFDVSPYRKRGEISGIDITNIPCCEKIYSKIISCINNISDVKHHVGTIMTGDQFIHSEEKLKSLSKDFSGIACEMEAGSIGQVCHINKKDFAIIRAISDNADQNANVDFVKFTKYASDLAANILLSFIRSC